MSRSLLTNGLLLLCFSQLGCNRENTWTIESRILSQEQLERQRVLLAETNLPANYNDVIGESAKPFTELLDLSNEMTTRGDEIIYTFLIPESGDDGSDGRLNLFVTAGKITRAEYQFVEK